MLEDAQAVCDPSRELAPELLDGIEELVSKNLLVWTDLAEGEPRIGMLETIREYALEQLDAEGEVEGVRGRHTSHYLGKVETAAAQLDGQEQATWLDRLGREHDNLRAALT